MGLFDENTVPCPVCGEIPRKEVSELRYHEFNSVQVPEGVHTLKIPEGCILDGKIIKAPVKWERGDGLFLDGVLYVVFSVTSNSVKVKSVVSSKDVVELRIDSLDAVERISHKDLMDFMETCRGMDK